MSKWLLTDELWAAVEPVIPKHESSPKGGHPRVDDRTCLRGIIFVLKTGIAWEDFPQELGCSGMTLWNRLHEWQRAGVWDRIHRLLLDRLREADRLDFSRAAVDSASIRAQKGGSKPDRIPSIAASRAASITC